MAVIDPQATVNAAQPWCCVPKGDLWFGVLAALIAVGNGDPMPDAEELMADIACLKCAVQSGDVPLLILGAAANITGGGGGGSGSVLTGSFADPNGNITPTDPTKGAWYYQDGAANNNLWRWSVDDQAWYQSLGI